MWMHITGRVIYLFVDWFLSVTGVGNGFTCLRFEIDCGIDMHAHHEVSIIGFFVPNLVFWGNKHPTNKYLELERERTGIPSVDGCTALRLRVGFYGRP